MNETADRRPWSVEVTNSCWWGVSSDSVDFDVTPLPADVRDLSSDVHNLSERVARIEGALSGPYILSAKTPETPE